MSYNDNLERKVIRQLTTHYGAEVASNEYHNFMNKYYSRHRIDAINSYKNDGGWVYSFNKANTFERFSKLYFPKIRYGVPK